MNTSMYLIIFAILIAISIGGAFVAIWAVNTLFATTIAFTAKNIFATWVLIALVNASASSNRK